MSDPERINKKRNHILFSILFPLALILYIIIPGSFFHHAVGWGIVLVFWAVYLSWNYLYHLRKK